MSGDAFTRLLALGQFGIKLGLENIRTLCEALEHPERAWPSVHIAGTNGKGSVTAMVERALRAHGYRTGRYTSPHLVSLTERIAIDGTPIDEADLSDVVSRVLEIEERCLADGRLASHVTFFEATTAAAFEAFRRAAVDVAVVEVGLGGRFDATNIVSPAATAIVSIGLDHTRHLGTTIEAIAAEKAGIAKASVPMVIGEVDGRALAVIEEACHAAGAPVVHASEGAACLISEPASDHAEIEVATATRRYGPLVLGLAGRHQVANALVALRLLEELDSQGLAVTGPAIEAGLRDVSWPGRLERVLLGEHELLLDAAHNEAGAAVLAAHLRAHWPERPALVFAVSADKDAAGMLRALAPAVGDIILTRFAGGRSAAPDDLAPLVPDAAGRQVSIVTPARAALDAALSRSRRVVVAGSMFLLGELAQGQGTRNRERGTSQGTGSKSDQR